MSKVLLILSPKKYKDNRRNICLVQSRDDLVIDTFEHWKQPNNMAGIRDRTLILSELKVIPDVLPANIELSYDLRVEWPEAKLDAPGKELGREETQAEPKVFLSPPVR